MLKLSEDSLKKANREVLMQPSWPAYVVKGCESSCKLVLTLLYDGFILLKTALICLVIASACL